MSTIFRFYAMPLPDAYASFIEKNFLKAGRSELSGNA